MRGPLEVAPGGALTARGAAREIATPRDRRYVMIRDVSHERRVTRGRHSEREIPRLAKSLLKAINVGQNPRVGSDCDSPRDRLTSPEIEGWRSGRPDLNRRRGFGHASASDDSFGRPGGTRRVIATATTERPASAASSRSRSSGRPGVLRRRAPLGTGRASLPASGSSKPWWLAGGVAVEVDETGCSLVRVGCVPDDVDRLASGGQPVLPFAWGFASVLVGEQGAVADRAAAVLGSVELSGGEVDRQRRFASSAGPVVGKLGVIG